MNKVKKRLSLIYQLLFILASIALITVGTLTFHNLEQSASQAAWVEHTHQVSLKTEHLFLHVKEAESGVRGYNLSGVEAYLGSYQSSLDSVALLFTQLKQLTADNASQQKKLNLLEDAILERKEVFEKNIALHRTSRKEELLDNYKKLTGKVKTDIIQGLIRDINATESRLLAIRQQALVSSYIRTKWLIITILVFFPVIAFYAFWLIRRYLSEKEVFEKELIDSNKRLKKALNEVDSMNRELATANEELQASNEELHATNEELATTTEEMLAAHESVTTANQRLEELNSTLEQKIEERILELKERNEALQRVNNDLDDFVYTAAHDLKSPANTLEGLVEILTFQLNDNATPAVNQTLSLMTNSTTRLKRTIHELTQILRVQKEEGLPKDIIRFHDLFEEVKADIKSLINQIMPEIHTDWQVTEMLYPQKHLRSILYNLLSNAIKYHHPERKAIISIRSYALIDNAHKKQIFLRIEDNGLGMDAKHLKQLFTMFKRFHDHVEGSGIGLYTIKRIIENNGGSIDVISEAGTGTCFTILLDTTDNA